MPRFVLLRHECPVSSGKPSHWDFMLESGGALRTWDLRELPASWASALDEASHATEVTALPLPDHRIEYLDYEGPVSGDRGSVRCCDRGMFELVEADQESLTAVLAGALLRGTIRLHRQGEQWQLSAS